MKSEIFNIIENFYIISNNNTVMNVNQQLNLKDIIFKALKSKLNSSDYITLILYENWKIICGTSIWKKTKPRSFKKNILTVGVDNPVILFELRFSKEELINKINNYFSSTEKGRTPTEKQIVLEDIRLVND